MSTKIDYKPVALNIDNIINSLSPRTFEELKKYFNSNYENIYLKETPESNLVMFSNIYSKKKIEYDDVYMECRSIILDKETLKVICYTYDDIIYNDEAKSYMLSHDDYEKVFYECFEGTLLSLYHYNGKWNVATRRCINAENSRWKSNKSYYELFLECLSCSFEEFTSHLSESNNYYFVLVHHENKNIVDYTSQFGENYKEIIHVMTRDRETHMEFNLSDSNQWKVELKIRQPKTYKDLSILDEENKVNDLKFPITNEGILVKMFNKDNGKSYFLKIQTKSYESVSSLKPNNSNIIVSFINLYQQDNLKTHIEYFPDNNMITDHLTNSKYDTIGMIDASFKVLTSELIELFKYLYNLKDCSHKNKDTHIYDNLPNEYKTVMYKIRGIYYKKKEKYIANNKSTNDNIKLVDTNSSLRIADIYHLLKSYNIQDLINLFRARKTIKINCQNDPDSDYDKLFTSFSHRCEGIFLKMIYILLNNLFKEEPQIKINEQLDLQPALSIS